MPKVSPLRMLIGSTPRANRHQESEAEHPQDEHSSTTPAAKQDLPPPATLRPKKSASFATVYPHSENVPESLVTPEKRPKGKFSWYQRQVKNLGGAVEADCRIPRNPSSTPRPIREPLQSSTNTYDVGQATATPRRNISRSLKYTAPQSGGAYGEVQLSNAPYFELEEDKSFWLEHSVQVLIRSRPLSSDEISRQGYERCIRQESAHTLLWLGNPETRFTFDHVACEATTQEKLFKVAGMPMVENCMRGYNGCIFAYGQTGSGKTHTVLGDIYRKQSENRGISPRIFEHLFLRIQMEEDARRHEKLKYTCKCSFLEIYNEQITDLLEPSSTNLQVREDSKRGMYVENLTEVEVHSLKDVTSLLLQGASNRKVAATNMNRESSRSHSVLTCVVESKWERDAIVNRRFSRLNLVDLAGSERQKFSGAENERLKEAVNINKSLSTLGLVIMILVDVANGKQRHVPYRDSKLTYLLQDSLGGNSKTMIIATVSPSASCSMDTLSTLKFAQRAKFICNNAVVNEDNCGDVNSLRQQIHKLKEEVHRLRSQTSEASSCVDDESSTERTSIVKATPRGRELNKMLSAEFRRLNQLRESIEAELDVGTADNYHRKLQDVQTQNLELRRQVEDLKSALESAHQLEDRNGGRKRRTKNESLELDQEEQLRTISNLEALLQKSEESRLDQATTITRLEISSKQSVAEVNDLKSQLKEAKNVQEQMESQQLFLMHEFETLLDEHNKMSEALRAAEDRERKLKDQLRLLNWELKKKQELQDLEKELETRASAESLVGYVDEEEKLVLEAKLRKTRKELEEARKRNLLLQGEQASRMAQEKQMDNTRAEVEAETANTISCLNRELMAAKEQCEAANHRAAQMMAELEDLRCRCKTLTEESSRLRTACKLVVEERDSEVQDWEDATGKLIEYFAEGDQALTAAAKEMEEILEESLAGRSKQDEDEDVPNEVELLQQKLQQVFNIARDAEGKVKALSALSEQQKGQIERNIQQMSFGDIVDASNVESLKSQLEKSQKEVKEAEKKAQTAFIVVRHLEKRLQSKVAGDGERNWKTEKEELLMELTQAKMEAAAKTKETANVLQKFRDSQTMLREAEQLLNALVKANESAKSGAHGWREEMSRSMPCLPHKYLESKLEKAQSDMAVMKQELLAVKVDTVRGIGDVEQEVHFTMRSIEESMKDILTFIANFKYDIKDEFIGLRDKMYEMMGEADSLIMEMRRKNELVMGLEYDISLLQEAFSEANEKRVELQDANSQMQEELDAKTNEMNMAETELLSLLKTLTNVESELRTLKETTSYLSSENQSQEQKITQLQDRNNHLELELEEKKRLIQSLDQELLEMSSLVERRLEASGEHDVEDLASERDVMHEELLKLRDQLDASRNSVEELQSIVAKSGKVAEEYQALVDEKDEEVKVLERSVQELESTITTLENQISIIKREAELQRLLKEDLEMELHTLRCEHPQVTADDEVSSYCSDKIKMLRLEEEVEHLREECLARDAKLTELRRHIAELIETSRKEARDHRRKIKELEASFEDGCLKKAAPSAQKPPERVASKVKGSGSPFKCMGLGMNTEKINEELSASKRRLEELQAMKSARDKEVFMLNAKLAQAESMTYDVVRDLLGVKHDITSYVVTQQRC